MPAFTLPDKPPRERIVGGYRIPKNVSPIDRSIQNRVKIRADQDSQRTVKTTILIDSYAINIRNPFWGPDSRQYRPSRFASIPPQQVS